MKNVLIRLYLCLIFATVCIAASAADSLQNAAADTKTAYTSDTVDSEENTGNDAVVLSSADKGMHSLLKQKFIEGSPGFMSMVALILILGLSVCIERIVYLTMSEINAKKFMNDIDEKLENNDVEGAKDICRNTRGPVASICYQGLLRIPERIDNIERSVVAYASVQAANLEKHCSWITLFIAMAPSLGFLGTVIGMMMSFSRIEMAGDISPTIVAAGMKVALITTIFGIIAALILQVFYNYVLSKIEHLSAQMEESAISLLDAIMKYKLRNGSEEE